MNAADDRRPVRRALLAATALAVAAAAAVGVGAIADAGMAKAYRRLLKVANSGAESARRHADGKTPPASRISFHHYLTCLLADYESSGSSAAERYTRLTNDICAAQALDPDNARLDFVMAAKLLEEAVESKSTMSGVTPDGKAKVRSELVIKQRDKVEDAMRLLERGLAKPEYRRYIGAILDERLSRLAPPRSLADQVERLELASATPSPDPALMRTLSRGAAAYAALLVREGRKQEAEPFLAAWKSLAGSLIRDSYSLVDPLMAAAIVKETEIRVPDLYRQIGQPEKAEAMRNEARALTAPVQEWGARRTAPQTEADARAKRDRFMRQSGILVSMLLPALTGFPSGAELAPSRAVDYILFDGLFLTGLAVAMAAAMLFWLAWLFRARGTMAGLEPPAGMAVWRPAALKVLWCVVLPLVVFLVVTRLTPLGGRDDGLPYAWPKAILQLETLAVAMFLLRYVLDRAEAAGATGIRPRVAAEIYLACLAALLAAALCIPVKFFNAERPEASRLAMILPLLALAAGVAVHAVAVWLAHRRATPVERWNRALVTVAALGLGILVLTIGGKGYLWAEERRAVQGETLLNVVPSEGGYTVAEGRLTHTLRDRMLDGSQGK